MSADLQARLQERSTDELVDILQAHDLEEWRPEVFPLVESILAARGVDVAAVKSASREESAGDPEPGELVRLQECPDIGKLAIVKSVLEGSDIAFFVQNERTQNLFGWGQVGGYNFITGPPVVMVDALRLSEARELVGALGEEWLDDTPEPSE